MQTWTETQQQASTGETLITQDRCWHQSSPCRPGGLGACVFSVLARWSEFSDVGCDAARAEAILLEAWSRIQSAWELDGLSSQCIQLQEPLRDKPCLTLSGFHPWQFSKIWSLTRWLRGCVRVQIDHFSPRLSAVPFVLFVLCCGLKSCLLDGGCVGLGSDDAPMGVVQNNWREKGET